jgi:hypothetical protein
VGERRAVRVSGLRVTMKGTVGIRSKCTSDLDACLFEFDEVLTSLP